MAKLALVAAIFLVLVTSPWVASEDGYDLHYEMALSTIEEHKRLDMPVSRATSESCHFLSPDCQSRRYDDPVSWTSHHAPCAMHTFLMLPMLATNASASTG